MTAFVVASAATRYDTGIMPLVETAAEQVFERGSQPLRAFMQTCERRV
jgi:hypothetical protein